MTISASVGYANMMQVDRVLVVCPANVCDDWLRGIKEGKHDTFAYVLRSSRYGVSDKANWTVTTPEIIHKAWILRALSKQHFGLLLTLSSLEHRIPEEITAACSQSIPYDCITDERPSSTEP